MTVPALDRFRLESPIGELVGYVREGALCALDFGDRDESNRALLERRFGAFRRGGPFPIRSWPRR